MEIKLQAGKRDTAREREGEKGRERERERETARERVAEIKCNSDKPLHDGGLGRGSRRTPVPHTTPSSSRWHAAGLWAFERLKQLPGPQCFSEAQQLRADVHFVCQ